jgi:hypothetical protein
MAGQTALLARIASVAARRLRTDVGPTVEGPKLPDVVTGDPLARNACEPHSDTATIHALGDADRLSRTRHIRTRLHYPMCLIFCIEPGHLRCDLLVVILGEQRQVTVTETVVVVVLPRRRVTVACGSAVAGALAQVRS